MLVFSFCFDFGINQLNGDRLECRQSSDLRAAANARARARCLPSLSHLTAGGKEKKADSRRREKAKAERQRPWQRRVLGRKKSARFEPTIDLTTGARAHRLIVTANGGADDIRKSSVDIR